MALSPESSLEYSEHWRGLVRHTPLAILTDLDGTLIPFAPTPDAARIEPAVLDLLRDLSALQGVTLAVVSGRTRESIDRMLTGLSHVHLVAEHGGWIRSSGAWRAVDDSNPQSLDGLVREFEAIAARFKGALVERKTWAVTIHHRLVRESERPELLIELASKVDPWLASHPGFERMESVQAAEVRPVRLRKSIAVPWVRDLSGPGSRVMAIGDDLTDEDMFRALGVGDEAIQVGQKRGRASTARWRLKDPAATVSFLRWILAARREGPTPEPPVLPIPIKSVTRIRSTVGARFELLSVSNRLPHLRSSAESGMQRKKGVGGLVSALEPALAARKGVWLGWSGQVHPGPEAGPVLVDDEAQPSLAWLDFPAEWQEKYYNGFCNRTLWPIFHSFVERVKLSEDHWTCYARVNDAFAQSIVDLVTPTIPVWAHDYHLLLMARSLRRRGHKGPMGLFLHIPFPPADLFSVLPWAETLLDGMLDFDLLGFHTTGFVDNFRQCVGALSPAKVADDVIVHRGRRIRIREFPIGIIPEEFQGEPDPAMAEEIASLLSPLSGSRLIVGIDRLDYTKGIPERLLAFGRLLELYPEWRGKVSFLQVSVPSRENVPEYAEQRSRVENIVGRINGEYGEASWVPIRYLYRSYGRVQLSQLYRAAHVGCVTPLRDGMNLVAKEYVAAQNSENPGVLLLSSFAGAARELRDALLTNPWHVDGMARDMDRALRMSLEERRTRHARLLGTVTRTTALTWAQDFLSTLEACRS